jgi:hypothetical protein
VCRGNIIYLYAFSIVYISGKSLFKFYYKSLKSIDLINLENAYEYFVLKHIKYTFLPILSDTRFATHKKKREAKIINYKI